MSGLLWGVLAVSLSGLTPEQQRGRELYFRGVGAGGREVRALVSGDVPVAAAVVPCAGCHGHDGRGRPEGGVSPPDVTWEALTRPYGGTAPSGRTHPAYDARSLKRAVTLGLDPAGVPLSPAMPRFQLTQAEFADLLAWLRVLGRAPEPGLFAQEVRIGVILPPERLEGLGQAVRAALEGFARSTNASGGIFGRRLALYFLQPPEPPDERVRAIRAFLEREQPFALAGSFLGGAEAEVSALASELGLPVVGALAARIPAGAADERYVFYVAGGLVEQARALVAFAAREPGTLDGPAVIVRSGNGQLAPVIEALAAGCRDEGWTQVVQVEAPEAAQAREWARALLARKPGAVFFSGPVAPARGLLREAGAGAAPRVFALGALAGSGPGEGPALPGARIHLAFPSWPPASVQLQAQAALRVLQEGLARAGRDVSREKLIDALEGLYDFETPFVPPLRYGPHRRVGLWGAQLMTVELDEGGRLAAGPWIELRP